MYLNMLYFIKLLLIFVYVIECFIYIVISHTLVFYGCSVPELSYLIEIEFRCPHQIPYLLYIFILCYNFLMGVIK